MITSRRSNAGMQPLTILVIGDSSSTHVAIRAKWFAGRGHRVFLLTASASSSEIEGVTELVEPLDHLASRPWLRRVHAWCPRPFSGALYYSLSVAAFVRAIRTCRPDILHIHSAYNYYGWIAGLLGSRPLVVSVMGSDLAPFESRDFPTSGREWLTLRLLHAADYITPQSDFLVGVVNGLGDYCEKTERILWGVSLDKFSRRDARDLRRDLGLARDARVILSPKILRPFYRVHLLVEAMPRVREACPDAVLVMSEFGADPMYREKIAHRIDELGLAEHAIFVGVIDYADMPNYYSMAEVSIAIPPRDAIPHALFESLACGTPHILSRLPRYEEIVQHEESAYFVDPDLDSIAAGIIHLLDDAPLRARIAERGRRIVEEQANLDEQAARVEELSREIVATTPPRTFQWCALVSTGVAAAHLYTSSRRLHRARLG